jgi:hypothetical protein
MTHPKEIPPKPTTGAERGHNLLSESGKVRRWAKGQTPAGPDEICPWELYVFKGDHLGGEMGLVLWRHSRQDVGNRCWLLIDRQDVPALAQECHGFGPGTIPQINGESGGMGSLSETEDRLLK